MSLQVQSALESIFHQGPQLARVVYFAFPHGEPLASSRFRIAPCVSQVNVVNAFLVETVIPLGKRNFPSAISIVGIPGQPEIW
jgi:hypothetical protein